VGRDPPSKPSPLSAGYVLRIDRISTSSPTVDKQDATFRVLS
jgi:hypothetical protein